MPQLEYPEPYIGISGVAHNEQHTALFDIARREKIDKLGYFMMIGVQATGKTQVQEVENSRGKDWHPVGDDISQAATIDDTEITKPFIHVFFQGEDELSRGIANVMRRTRHYSRGLQFNGLDWIGQDYRPFLDKFKEDYPEQSIILQTNKYMLDRYPPEDVAEELRSMPVEYILLDTSGGAGQRLDEEFIGPFVDEIYQCQIPKEVVIAGGLDAQNVYEVFGPFNEIYPFLCCDAEGRLRKGSPGKSVLDLQAAEDFIVAWKKALTYSSFKRS